MTKICFICKQEKDVSEFWKNKNKIDGYEIYCKACANKRKTEQRAKITEEQQKEQQKQMNGLKTCTVCNIEKTFDNFNKDRATKDGLSCRCKSCQKVYDDDRKQEKQKYYKDNIDIFIKYREEHREQNIKYQKQYRLKHQQILNEKDRLRNRERYEDLNYHLSKVFSNSLNASLKVNKAEKHWETLVDYNLQQLKEHLEFQFTPKMNWDNFGSYWEIDHIVPRNLFSYTTEQDEQFQTCWSLKNLRPLSKIKKIEVDLKMVET